MLSKESFLQTCSKCDLERKRNINQCTSWLIVVYCNRGMEVSQSRSHTPDSLSPDRQQQQQQQQQVQSPASRGPGPSPTMQQRIKAIGVPTPLAMSSPIRRSVNTWCSGAGVYNLSYVVLEFSPSNFFPISFCLYLFFLPLIYRFQFYDMKYFLVQCL